jgi:pimeloyl-ACP methyl ester carboxylesterase
MNLSRWRDTGLRFDFSGHSIFYRYGGRDVSDETVRANSSEPALLLIHGFPTSSWDWAPIWPELCTRFDHVLAPDLLGFGYSAKPLRHRYSLLQQTDLCEALLARYGLDRVHVLAHDYGVSIAQELLARHRERGGRGLQLQSVTLLNGGLFPETHRQTMGQRFLRSPLFGRLAVALMNERRFGRALGRVFGEHSRPSTIEMHDLWTVASSDRGMQAMRGLIRYISERRQQRARWVGALQQTPVPLRLINGPADPVSGAHMADRYRELVPNPDVVSLDGIGHYPQLEAPDRTLRAFLEFQRRLSQRPD